VLQQHLQRGHVESEPGVLGVRCISGGMSAVMRCSE
jgi:hypothetical protein